MDNKIIIGVDLSDHDHAYFAVYDSDEGGFVSEQALAVDSMDYLVELFCALNRFEKPSSIVMHNPAPLLIEKMKQKNLPVVAVQSSDTQKQAMLDYLNAMIESGSIRICLDIPNIRKAMSLALGSRRII